MLAGVIGRMARRRGSHRRHRGGADRRGHRGGLGRGRQRRRSRHRAGRTWKPVTTAAPPTWRPPSAPGARAGRWGGCSPGSNVPDLENALTVFELAELKGRGDVQAVVLMLVVFLATQRMYHGPRTSGRKRSSSTRPGTCSRGRTRRRSSKGRPGAPANISGALVTGTQSVNDYYANPAARAAWENSDWVIFLAQKDESVELLKSGEAHPLRSRHGAGAEELSPPPTAAMPSWCLHGPDGWRVARLVLDAWSVALFSSRGPAFAAVERLEGRGALDGRGHRPDCGRRPSRGGRSPEPALDLPLSGHSENANGKGGPE